jgi:hypothetical protein
MIGIVANIDGERLRLGGVIPARTIGAILIGLAILKLMQDASGAVVTALAGGAPLDPLARHVWITDLALEVPAMLLGGGLLWRHERLNSVCAPRCAPVDTTSRTQTAGRCGILPVDH